MRNPESRPSGIHDGAQLAGGSPPTMSRLLNEHPSVKPTTRGSVKDTISPMNDAVLDAAAQGVVARIGDSTPTVARDGSRTESSELLVIDQAHVVELATTHLLDLGCETVWHLSGPQDWIEAFDRSEGSAAPWSVRTGRCHLSFTQIGLRGPGTRMPHCHSHH